MKIEKVVNTSLFILLKIASPNKSVTERANNEKKIGF